MNLVAVMALVDEQMWKCLEYIMVTDGDSYGSIIFFKIFVMVASVG